MKRCYVQQDPYGFVNSILFFEKHCRRFVHSSCLELDPKFVFFSVVVVPLLQNLDLSASIKIQKSQKMWHQSGDVAASVTSPSESFKIVALISTYFFHNSAFDCSGNFSSGSLR
jgi:hypothetical protein